MSRSPAYKSVTGKLLTQFLQDAQGLVVLLLAVVDEHQREHGIRARLDPAGGSFLEHLDAALTAAAKSGGIGDESSGTDSVETT